MLFRQLFDAASSTYTYILGCDTDGKAVIIDPVFEQHERDLALLRELGLSPTYSIDTHVHADHVTGSWLMREATGAQIVLSKEYGADGVDIPAGDGTVVAFGGCSLTALATPGHTNGCITWVTHDRAMAFTGDTLLIRGAGRTDFQSGDAHEMWHSIREKIFTLSADCLLYPGHDYMGRTVSTVAEEQRYNPRIGGEAREEDFCGYMDNLGLAHPRQLEIALPANMRCGKPEEPRVEKPAWGPVIHTFAGVPEVPPDWVARHRDEITLIDVRSEAEFGGELGHIDDSQLIPLDCLRDRLDDIPRDKPVITVCQSGKRSAMAAQILEKAGFDVANLPGGVLHWHRLSLPGLVM